MSKNQTVDLANGFFSLQFEDGFLKAIKPGGKISGEKDSVYIEPGKAAGGFSIVTSKATVTAVSESDFSFDKTSDDGKSSICSTLRREDLGISVSENWVLHGEDLEMTLEIENISEEAVSIDDLALIFASDSTFSWGCNAAAKVISHNWICGSNSHFIYERCDGKGPMLAAVPTNGTSFEYYEHSTKEKGSLTAYIHSCSARKNAVTQGANIHIPATKAIIPSGKSARYGLQFFWAADDNDLRNKLVQHGMMDIQVLPGMTVPESAKTTLAVRGNWHGWSISLPDGCSKVSDRQRGEYRLITLVFSRLGENTLWLTSHEKKCGLEFFVTEKLETTIEKRGSFIANHQIRDHDKWYDGLLCEHNNETGALLSPDNYDKIGGWRIYEVTCDDPGLSKPAFLSGKLAEHPVREQVAALDYYVEHFVWGGLQRTEEEEFPYAIYGIPDWKTLRDSKDQGVKGKQHIWRIYDYPHIALMYYNMYRIASLYDNMPLSQSPETYLRRSAMTLIAMFTIPLELDDWSAFGTGLYNELICENVLSALEKENMSQERIRLERLWNRKAYKFAHRGADVFGSEYPFDTTGFESTHALAKRALTLAKSSDRKEDREISPENAAEFMETQMRCNISCRGKMEMAYWWYGSDYRGDNMHYTLSYMSQMGGWSILDYALYHADDPFPFLRLGYGSLMSSWALLNSGREDTNYGWRFPGKGHDGAASGGFEPLYLGETWLDQPHHGGAWYYSCEIDLGFCGYLRGAATVYSADPVFGTVCLGGCLTSSSGIVEITPEDGVNRRFHIVTMQNRLHLLTGSGKFAKIIIDSSRKTVSAIVNIDGLKSAPTVTCSKTALPDLSEEEVPVESEKIDDTHIKYSIFYKE